MKAEGGKAEVGSLGQRVARAQSRRVPESEGRKVEEVNGLRRRDLSLDGVRGGRLHCRPNVNKHIGLCALAGVQDRREATGGSGRRWLRSCGSAGAATYPSLPRPPGLSIISLWKTRRTTWPIPRRAATSS